MVTTGQSGSDPANDSSTDRLLSVIQTKKFQNFSRSIDVCRHVDLLCYYILSIYILTQQKFSLRMSVFL
jgi:hypothetical protein